MFLRRMEDLGPAEQQVIEGMIAEARRISAGGATAPEGGEQEEIMMAMSRSVPPINTITHSSGVTRFKIGLAQKKPRSVKDRIRVP